MRYVMRYVKEIECATCNCDNPTDNSLCTILSQTISDDNFYRQKPLNLARFSSDFRMFTL